jgi:transposase
VEQQQQYVGIDLHRRRSVIVRRNASGETLDTVRIDNDPVALAAEVAKAGPHPEVILEATYGWYWAADVLQECGATIHLSHPLGNNWGNRRVKNDERDATDLVDLLRLGRLAEAWIAPPPLRELREYIRYRAKLVQLRSNLKAQVHSVLAKEGVTVPMTDLFGVKGHHLLNDVQLADAYRVRVESLRDLIELFDREVAMLEDRIDPYMAGDLGYHAVQAIPGVGPVLASVFTAEIGDVSRFKTARHLCSWAGLTPTHHESDDKVRRGHITKQGSRLVRWAAVEAVAHQRGDTPSRRTTATSASAAAPRSGASLRPANFSSSSTTAFATARSAAWPRRDENRDGRNPVRARPSSWPPLVGVVAPLIEPTGLRPNHSMSPRRDEEMNGTRGSGLPASTAWPWRWTATRPRLGTTKGTTTHR